MAKGVAGFTKRHEPAGPEAASNTRPATRAGQRNRPKFIVHFVFTLPSLDVHFKFTGLQIVTTAGI
jgi:hypothetical protein